MRAGGCSRRSCARSPRAPAAARRSGTRRGSRATTSPAARRSARARMRAPSATAISSPSATRACSATTTGATDQPSSRGSRASTTATAWSCTAAGRQPVGDHDDEVVLAGLELVVGGEAPPEVGALQVARRGRRPASARRAGPVAERGDDRVGVQRRCARRRGPRRARREARAFSAVGSASPARPSATRARVAARSASTGRHRDRHRSSPSAPGSRVAAPARGTRPASSSSPIRLQPRLELRRRPQPEHLADRTARPGTTATGSAA